MIRYKSCLAISIFLTFTTSCMVSQEAYDIKVQSARDYRKRYDITKKENKELKLKIKSSNGQIVKIKKEINRYKKQISEYEAKLNEMERKLDEKDMTLETIQSNLDMEISDKNKGFSKITTIQKENTDRINAMKKSYTLEIEKQKNELTSALETLKAELAKKDTLYKSEQVRAAARFNDLMLENQDLATVKLAQSKEIKDLLTRLTAIEGKLKKKIFRLKGMENIRKRFKKALKLEIAEGKAKVFIDNNRVIVRIITDALFSQKDITALEKIGRNTLRKTASIIKSLKDASIQIEGHTDNRGISGTLKEQFPSNWNLSATRAVNVVRYLAESLKVDPKTLSSIGHSSYKPVADNETPEGRRLNRRVEIVVVPNPG